MATLRNEFFLSPVQLLTVLVGRAAHADIATDATGHKRGLGTTIFLREVCALKGGVTGGWGDLVKLELMDTLGGDREREEEEGNGSGEHDGVERATNELCVRLFAATFESGRRLPESISGWSFPVPPPSPRMAPGVRTRRAASQPEADASSLNNLERLILAQAVHELGTEPSQWPKIGELLGQHPMVQKPKNFFTAQVSPVSNCAVSAIHSL